MATSRSSSLPTQYDKEIDALLNRVHSGCRIVDFEDSGNRRKGSGDGVGNNVSNLLRNASPPDETHAELGHALAHSYIRSLQSISSSSNRSSKYESDLQRAVERGERIIQSSCCGENGVKNDGRSSIHPVRANYASTSYAFFGHMRSFFSMDAEADASTKAFIQRQWQNWCTQCEEFVFPMSGMPTECNGGGVHTLYACLNNYAYMCYLSKACTNAETDGSTSCGCACVYESLKNHSSRKYLIRTSITHAVSLAQSNRTGFTIGIVESLSPLFYSSVLKAQKAIKQNCNHAERQLILQETFRGCYALLHRILDINDPTHDEKDQLMNQISNWVDYLSTSLTSYLKQNIHASFSKLTNEDTHYSRSNVLELGYDWLRGLCELMEKFMQMNKNDAVQNVMSRSIENIFATVLPQFNTSSMVSIIDTFEMVPIYSSLRACIISLPQDGLFPIANATMAFRLGSLALNLQDDTEVQMICDLMHSIFQCMDRTSGDNSKAVLTGSILTALGCVFRCRSACFDSATQLANLGESTLRRTNLQKYGEVHEAESHGQHIMDIIMHALEGEGFRSLVDIISLSISATERPSTLFDFWQRRPLLLKDQCSGLLLGLSLLHLSISSSQPLELSTALGFLRSFLQCYPRMASRVVPSLIVICRTCQSHITQTLLKFVASPCVVSDPHGAHLAWTFLSSLANDDMPSSVRSTVIRLLPGMCSSNKRLFRRCRDIIGKSIIAQDPIIRISATAALSDMANLDLLRDIEQIVGWIQNRLADIEPAVVYYALETLRYLVVNEELEFDLVARVLEKRLDVDLSNVQTVLALDVLVLEGLLALMGGGGLEEEDSDDESNYEDEGGGPDVSPQSIKAVSLLVDLANCQNKGMAFLPDARIQRRIYQSLSGYSSQVLGLDGESLRSWDGTDLLATKNLEEMSSEIKRFLCLKELVLTGFDFAVKLYTEASSIGNADEVEEIGAELLESVTSIAKTILQFEEDVHGSFLFRGGYSSGRGSSEKTPKGKVESRTRVSNYVISSLPTASNIQDMFESDPRSASATAVFYSISSSENNSKQTEDILCQMSECFGDIVNEPLLDPVLQSIQVSALIQAMESVWKSIQKVDENMREQLIDQVVARTEEWSETFGEYTAMAAFVLAVDDPAQCWSGVTTIQNTIMRGKDSFLFESEDTKLLCLAMVGARLSRTADSRVTGLIDYIEQSLLKHSRQTCFGAFFGLGIIATNLKTDNINGTDPSDKWRRQQAQRIVCLHLAALNACLTQENDVLFRLLLSTKNGEASDGISQQCSNLDDLLIQDGYTQRMRAIMIGLGHSFSVLNDISSALVKCVLNIIDKLPWGSGKGFALHAAYKKAINSGVIEQKDLSEAITNISSFVRELSSGVGDALLSLASFCHLSSKRHQEELDLIAKTCQEVLHDRKARIGNEDKLISILAVCAAIGDLPGLPYFTPNIHISVKKNFVAGNVKMLEEIALDDAHELKYRDAATLSMGILCSMRRLSHNHNQRQKNPPNEFDSIQAKDGSVMQSVLHEVEKTYSHLCAPSPTNDICREAAVKKICALFSALEPIAMPGNFNRVIELTLNQSLSNEMELKSSSINFLVSQLQDRRRIGFDGRGFVDLSTRLAKMPSKELCSHLGSNAIHMMATLLPNLLYQLPTSMGEEVAKTLWDSCQADLRLFMSPQSMAKFLVGLKRVFRSNSKKTISPALLRALQKFTCTKIFSDLCTDAVPSDKNSMIDVWGTYLQCLELVPSDALVLADGLNRDVDQLTVFGMAVAASLSSKTTRKVESWIARQEMENLSTANLRVLFLATLTIATQPRNDDEMKESILGLLEIMIVKGIDTMSLCLIAAKVSFWWESRKVHQVHCIDMPMHMTSFFVTKNLSFDAHALSPELLTKLFDSFVKGLPSKLAVLCEMWKISDGVLNRASRIWNASCLEEGYDFNPEIWSGRSRCCLRDIVQFINGGDV